ncbi:MAG: CBS domain-containing protein [Planctomycetes bacterium]|nr:CBS domain-containing protein [Planctomycetota bacterium]
MTQRRLRHVPVVDDGVLCGIISVDDVLKHKLEETKLELGVMRDVAIARAH